MTPIRRMLALALVACAATAPAQEDTPMELGQFSVSLTVKDIRVSLTFYEKLGFKQVGGKLEQNWVVLQNGGARIGLFQGMFPRNMLTFNPGWGPDRTPLERFQDVRHLQRTLKTQGISMAVAADEATQGPAHFVIVDPDGNPLLFDQHVASPTK